MERSALSARIERLSPCGPTHRRAWSADTRTMTKGGFRYTQGDAKDTKHIWDRTTGGDLARRKVDISSKSRQMLEQAKLTSQREIQRLNAILSREYVNSKEPLHTLPEEGIAVADADAVAGG